VAVHVWLGLAGCCAPPVPTWAPSLAKLAHASTDSLTVLALNTWHRLGDRQRLERYLKSAPADVIVLSEFGPDKRPMLARLKEAYPFQVECAHRWSCALALISRRPLTASGIGPLAADRQAGASQPMADFVWAKVGGSLTIIGTHVYRPSRDPWLHQRQMSALSRFLRNIDGPLVLAGDLGPRRERRGATAEARAAEDAAALAQVPVLVAADRPVTEWVTSADSRPGDFRAQQVARVVARPSNAMDVPLAPFYRTHRRNYSVYFDILTTKEFEERAAAAKGK